MRSGDDGTKVDYAALGTEQRNPRSADLDRLSTEDILRLINDEDRLVPDAVGREIASIAAAVDLVVRSLRSGGRVFYVGAGTSGRIGLLDAAEWPPTFGVDPGIIQPVVAGGAAAAIEAASPFEDDAQAAAADLAALDAGSSDVVIGLAASGVTPFVLGAMEAAKQRGCATVGLSNVPGSPLARIADVAITPVVGPEVLTGSTRMKAGTSQKLVLNMISTTAMVRLGKVYGNLMVDMSPSNRKLVDRARRIVAATTGLEPDVAARLLDAAGGSPKAAIVMALARVDRRRAEDLLARAEGHVREAVRRAQAEEAGA